MDAAAYYADHLGEINEAISIICRKNGIAPAEEKDFSQHVHLQLIEDDYRKIRAYRGSSSFRTYLYTVISRILIDQVRTKWHPSTEAKRLGTTAVALEKLVYRNNYSVREACQVLSMDPSTAVTEQQAHDLLATVRARKPRPIRAEDSEEQLPRVPDPAPDPEGHLARKQQRRREREVVDLIGTVLQAFSSEDKLLMKLVFIGGHKISEVARLLKKDERLVYRRTRSLLRNAKEALAAAGIGEADVRDILEGTGAFDD